MSDFRRDFSVKRVLAVNSSHGRNSVVTNISRHGSILFNARTRYALSGWLQVGLGSGARQTMRTGRIVRNQGCLILGIVPKMILLFSLTRRIWPRFCSVSFVLVEESEMCSALKHRTLLIELGVLRF